MKKRKSEDPCKFQYQEKEGDIVIITMAMGGFYDVHVYQNKDDALADLYNAWLCHYCILFVSDEEIEKEHQKQIADAPPRYGDEVEVVDEEGLFHSTT